MVVVISKTPPAGDKNLPVRIKEQREEHDMLPTESGSNIHSTLEKFRPGLAFVVMILGALVAFEIFNFTTTDHALRDLLGDLTFAGFIPWSMVLAIAFCGIDFAGIARLFTPEQGASEPKEVWYLFGAWLLAATMNAILTWWGVSMAVSNHQVQSAAVVDQSTLTGVVPVFVAIMVWIIRILIIGTLSLAMDRLLHPGAEQRTPLQTALSGAARQTTHTPAGQPARSSIPAGLSSSGYTARPAVRSASAAPRPSMRPPVVDDADDIFDVPARGRTDPTYHSIGAKPSNQSGRTASSDRFRRT
jgi:hypothetical protein